MTTSSGGLMSCAIAVWLTTIASQAFGDEIFLSGLWQSNLGISYVISHDGAKFEWQAPKLQQHATGTVDGPTLSVTWTDRNGTTGHALGKVVEIDPDGLAAKITWNNGVDFTRGANQRLTEAVLWSVEHSRRECAYFYNAASEVFQFNPPQRFPTANKDAHHLVLVAQTRTRADKTDFVGGFVGMAALFGNILVIK